MRGIESFLKEQKIASAIVISILTFGLVHLFFGFYYEEYESLFTALISGSLTPGMVYDYFPYMYMGGLTYIYAHLSSFFPGLPVMNILSFLSIIICLAILLYLYIASTQKELLWGLVIIVVLSIGYFELLNGTRRAILYSLTSSALFFYILKYKKPILSLAGVLSIGLWILGLLTRLETTVIFLSISGSLFLLIALYESSWKVELKYLLLALFYVVSAIGFMFVVQYKLIQSEDFYLQIEPDCEYELSIKENLISIGEMSNRVDSLRYLAVKKGLWGDAELNDAEYLKSLIGEERRGALAWHGVDFYKEELSLFIHKYQVYLLLYLFVSIFLLFQVGGKSKHLFFRLLLYSIVIVSMVFVVAVQLKSNHRVTESLLGSALILQWMVLNFYYPFSKVKFFSAVTFIAFPLLLLLSQYYKVSVREQVRKEYNQEQILFNQDFMEAETIYLTGKYTRMLLDTYSPFETFSVLENKNVILIDDLALTTTDPYRGYLSSKLNCNVLDYASFFAALYEFDENAMYLIDKDRMEFLKDYLKQVHNYNLANINILSLQHKTY